MTLPGLRTFRGLLAVTLNEHITDELAVKGTGALCRRNPPFLSQHNRSKSLSTSYRQRDFARNAKPLRSIQERVFSPSGPNPPPTGE